MPYSGCKENNRVFFFSDNQGQFQTSQAVCSPLNTTSWDVCSPSNKTTRHPCPIPLKDCDIQKNPNVCKPCLLEYHKCIHSGDMICENPSLYCDLFCNKSCQQENDELASNCFTECKLACLDEKKCPPYMANHCNNISCPDQIREDFTTSEMPATTSIPEQDLYFPEPTTEIPLNSRRHRRLVRESLTPVTQVQHTVARVAPSIPANTRQQFPIFPERHFQTETKQDKKKYILMVLILVIIILVLGALNGVMIWLLFFRKKPIQAVSIPGQIRYSSALPIGLQRGRNIGINLPIRGNVGVFPPFGRQPW